MFRRYNYVKFQGRPSRQETRYRPRRRFPTERDRTPPGRGRAPQKRDSARQPAAGGQHRRRHVGRSSCFFEVVSDGNLSLMRAVEKFDYSRGFKFSTYASWAIMRNYARSIPEQMYQAARLVTGSDEALAIAPAPDTSSQDTVIEGARHLIQKGLTFLSERERDIVVRHYG